MVQREPAVDRLGCVVRAVLEHGAVEQALPRDVVGDLEVEDDVELSTLLVEHRVERLGLRQRAREAVEHEPAQRVTASEPLADELDRELVRNEVAAREDRRDPAAEVGLHRDRLPEHVARRDVRNARLGGDPLRLGALAGPLRAEQQDVHYLRKPS